MSSFWKLVPRKRKCWGILIYALIISLTLFSLLLLYATPTPPNIILTTLLSHKFTLNNNGQPSQLEPSTSVTLAVVLCNDGHSGLSNSTRARRNFMSFGVQRQINQTVVLLKSIVIQEANFGARSFVPVEVLVLSDDFHLFFMLEMAIQREQWPLEFLKRIQLTFVPAAYPPGTEWMRNLFRPCSTLRLFLDGLLPNYYDSVIYMDTDFIFLRPISDLWSEFNRFNSENMAALAPCLNHYRTSKSSVPFYGETGLNSGLVLMNLTRIRRSNWSQSIQNIVKYHSKQLKLPDQDILNIYFYANPSKVHLLSCDWNFKPFQCQRGSFCLDWEIDAGISALHGNAMSFTTLGPEPIFHAVFSTFQTFNLSSVSQLENLTSSLSGQIMRVQRHKKIRSHCTRFGAFPKLLLNRMELRVRDLNRRANIIGRN